MSNPFDTFKDLPEELQKEAIREGEKLLDAQMTAANAADQRGLTWAGFLMTASTAALGGGLALFNKAPPDFLLGFIAVLFAGGLLRAAWLAIKSLAPRKFCFPGNRPGLWLPDQWDCEGTDERKVQTARTDQAKHLDKFINTNRGAEQRGLKMRRSIRWSFWAVSIAGVLLLTVTVARQCVIQEPISKVCCG